MAKIDKEYHKLLEKILKEGYTYNDPNRKGVKRLQIDNYQLEHKFSDGFPIITTRKLYYKGGIGEMLSFLAGENNLKDLHKNGVKFWNKDAYNYFLSHYETDKTLEDFLELVEKDYYDGSFYAYGDLGKIYPYQMRSWNGEIDQITSLIDTLKKNPMATKKTVTMWNPSDLSQSALSPCHFMFQAITRPLTEGERMKIFNPKASPMGSMVYTDEFFNSYGVPKYGLTIKFSMHSVDLFLGAPINMIFYSTLCYLISHICNFKPLGIIADLSNVHLYDNQIEPAKEILKRDVNTHKKQDIVFSDNYYRQVKEYKGDFTSFIKSLKTEDFTFPKYTYYPEIKVEMLPYS